MPICCKIIFLPGLSFMILIFNSY
uniref:Uncharacterized protein n=1 Tax=Rhizophora mucronata TaxID=61149 RepID=A0A2P2QIN8_RHIMU